MCVGKCLSARKVVDVVDVDAQHGAVPREQRVGEGRDAHGEEVCEEHAREGDGEEEEEEDISNMQLAWQMLELAGQLYERFV